MGEVDPIGPSGPTETLASHPRSCSEEDIKQPRNEGELIHHGVNFNQRETGNGKQISGPFSPE